MRKISQITVHILHINHISVCQWHSQVCCAYRYAAYYVDRTMLHNAGANAWNVKRTLRISFELYVTFQVLVMCHSDICTACLSYAIGTHWFIYVTYVLCTHFMVLCMCSHLFLRYIDYFENCEWVCGSWFKLRILNNYQFNGVETSIWKREEMLKTGGQIKYVRTFLAIYLIFHQCCRRQFGMCVSLVLLSKCDF